MGYGEEQENVLIREIWKELHLLMSQEIWVEVEHIKAHRTKKDQKGDVAIGQVCHRGQ